MKVALITLLGWEINGIQLIPESNADIEALRALNEQRPEAHIKGYEDLDNVEEKRKINGLVIEFSKDVKVDK